MLLVALLSPHIRKNHKLDHIVERTALPDELIRGASGKLAFEDQQPRVGHCSILYFMTMIE